jgi:hypothetical protein
MNPEEMMMQEEGQPPTDLSPEQIQQMLAEQEGQVPPEEGMEMSEEEMMGAPEADIPPDMMPPDDPMAGADEAPGAPPPGMESELQNQGIEDPREMLSEVANQYMDFAIEVKNNESLDIPLRAQIMVQMSQALNYMIPLLKDDGQADMMMKQQELELKQQEHEMNMQMKQAELEFKQQEMQLNLQMKQQEQQMKLQQSQQQNQIKLQQQQENHQHNIVQSHESHQHKMVQDKQAAQVKQSSKPVNDKGKKK